MWEQAHLWVHLHSSPDLPPFTPGMGSRVAVPWHWKVLYVKVERGAQFCEQQSWRPLELSLARTLPRAAPLPPLSRRPLHLSLPWTEACSSVSADYGSC